MRTRTTALNVFSRKLSLILFNILAVGFIVVVGKAALCPLVFAFLITLVLLPCSRFFERKVRLKRVPASILTVILLILFLAIISFGFGFELKAFINDWPTFNHQLALTLNALQQWALHTLHLDLEQQKSYLDAATKKVFSAGTAVLGETMASSLISLVLFFFYVFFLLVYRSLLMKFLVDIFQKKANRAIRDISFQVQLMVQKYIAGLLLEMLIVGVSCSLGFTLIGIKYAFFLGPLTGILNVIPYVGIFSSLSLTLFITLTTVGIAKAILVAIFVVCVHLIDSNLLLPYIVGSRVRLNALVTLLGVVTGELMWGVPGMFLSIPMIAIVKIFFDRIESLGEWGMLLGTEKKNIRPTGKSP